MPVTYTIRRSENGRAQPLWEIMQGIPAMPEPLPARKYERKAGDAYGPVRSPLRLQLEAMKVGEEIETTGRTAAQVGAIAYHVRRVIAEARYSAKTKGSVTVVRRIA